MKKHIVILENSLNIAANIESDLKSIYPDADISYFSYPRDGMLYIYSEIFNENLKEPSEWLVITGMGMKYSSFDKFDKKAGEIVLKDLRVCKMYIDAIIISPEEIDNNAMKSIYKNFIGSVQLKTLFNDYDTIKQYKKLLGFEI